MSTKSPTPRNYQEGLARSAAVRTGRSEEHSQKTWALILALAHGLRPGGIVIDPAARSARAKKLSSPPPTLIAYAQALNEAGHRTSRGLEWTPPTVQRVIKTIGGSDCTPKSLREWVKPQPFLPKSDAPKDVIGSLRVGDGGWGKWIPAIAVPPMKGDWVRLKLDVGDYSKGTVLRVSARKKGMIEVMDIFGDRTSIKSINIERWMWSKRMEEGASGPLTAR